MITIRPPAIRPDVARGRGASTTSRSRRWVALSCLPLPLQLPWPLVPVAIDAAEWSFAGALTVPLWGWARLVIRSTITPRVRARAIASIISGVSDRAFNPGNSSRSFPRISTRLDRVDPQIGFHVEVKPQGLDGVACTIPNSFEQPGGDLRSIRSAGRALGRVRIRGLAVLDPGDSV